MTNEESKKYLECAIGDGSMEFVMQPMKTEVLKNAVCALEKQIPKKVIDHDYCIAEYGDSGCQIGCIFFYKATCPLCNNTICDGELEKSDLMGIKYCDICGQALDWSDEE